MEIIKEIPLKVSKSANFYRFLIVPPSTELQPNLFDQDTTVVSGNGNGQGYSVAARIINRETNNERVLSTTIDVAETQDPDGELATILAQYLLVDAIHRPYDFDELPSPLASALAQIMTTTKKYSQAVKLAREKNTQTAIFTLAPHMCFQSNWSITEDINNSDFFRRLGSINPSKRMPAKDVVSTIKAYKVPSVILDASSRSNITQIYSLVSETTKNGIQPKLVGPKERVANILPGNEFHITWTVESLLALAQYDISEASGGQFNTLEAISTREVKALGKTIEEILIDCIVKAGTITPSSLIRSLNNLIRFSKFGEQKITIPALEKEKSILSKSS